MINNGIKKVLGFYAFIFISACGYRAPLAPLDDISEDDDEVLIVFTGDVMVHLPQINRAFSKESGGYDFSPSFKHIKGYIQKADTGVCNFESTLAGKEKGYSGHPRFNAPDELARDLKNVGFDFVATANNHSLDTKEEGLYRTVEIFRKAGMKPFGTAKTQAERNTPPVLDVNGITIAFLAYTVSTNQIPVPEGKEHIVNLIDTDDLKSAYKTFKLDIEKARHRGAELVAVYMHWGEEYEFEPGRNQKVLASLLARAGANLVLGSHPHVIQPMEYIEINGENENENKTLVAYSMGNFVSNQHYIPDVIPTAEVELGKILKIYVKNDKKESRLRINDVKYMLTWVDRLNGHRILPLKSVIHSPLQTYGLSKKKRSQLVVFWNRITERLEGFEHVDMENLTVE